MLTATTSPPNGKAMITEGDPGLTVAINGFTISGVAVPDRNGAAIRYEGGDLTLRDDYFYGNQEGLLGGRDFNGHITIDHSEFAFNGDGSGFTHDLYIGEINSFSITNSYIHDAIVGHEIKSRAMNNIIVNNRVLDNNGNASYSIDLPNGGNAQVNGNFIQQSANSQNGAILAYGEEVTSAGSVDISGNTIVNDRSGGLLLLNPAGLPVGFHDNSVYGLTSGQFGNMTASSTTFLVSRPVLDLSPISFITPTEPTPTPIPTPPKGHGKGGNGGGHGKGHLSVSDFGVRATLNNVINVMQTQASAWTTTSELSTGLPIPNMKDFAP